jgi:hypothetical protein
MGSRVCWWRWLITLLLLRLLLQSVRRQRLMALDVKQAQEVQQVILPEARLALPGLTIESEYRPALSPICQLSRIIRPTQSWHGAGNWRKRIERFHRRCGARRCEMKVQGEAEVGSPCRFSAGK